MIWQLNDSHYEKAHENGIPRNIVYHRVYSYGYDIDRAITEPVGESRKGIWTHHKEICEVNGIAQATLYRRLKRGWSVEEAINTPVIKPGRSSLYI